jgi:hypothetical protein
MPLRLSPAEIAQHLLVISPDRDERASQLCAETLLTLIANDYAPPQDGKVRSPKKRQFALRSIAMGTNFFEKYEEKRIGTGEHTPISYGQALAAARDFSGSENIALAKATLQGLIDPQTRRGQKGTWLLYPFSEDLLWYDARQTQGRPWDVRKVYMRGSGITLARLLLEPVSAQARTYGSEAVAALKMALREKSQMSVMAKRLQDPISISELDPAVQPEKDEQKAWEVGESQRLTSLSEALSVHACSIMRQNGTGSTAKLWHFRNLLGLDFAIHTIRSAWELTGMPSEDQYLLLSIGGPERQANFVRQRSEESYQAARTCIREAIILTLAHRMEQLAKKERRTISWESEFESRSNLEKVAADIPTAKTVREYEQLARRAYEQAAYDRPIDGFRVLLESIGMIQGHSGWRFFAATPDLMGSFVGALAEQMPMSSKDFLEELFKNWRIVLSPEIASRTSLLERLDGSELARNARRAERLLVEAGLAVSLSDSTTMVGENVGGKV